MSKTQLWTLEPTATYKSNWLKSFNFSSTSTSTTSSRGSQMSAAPYMLQPIDYLRTAIDAARDELVFSQAYRQEKLKMNSTEMVIPYRTKYLQVSDWETSSEQYAVDTNISATELDNHDGVKFTPVWKNYRVAMSYKNIETNALNVVSQAREDVTDLYAKIVDNSVRDSMFGTVAASPAYSGTEMTNSVAGTQTIFANDKTDAAGNLVAGDIATPELFRFAKRLLKSPNGYYWNSNVWTKSAVRKNAWKPKNEDFILFIPDEVEEQLTNDSQFNASEFGSDRVVLTGEIGTFAGMRVVVSSECPSFSSGDKIKVQSNDLQMSVDGHICALVKARVCGATVMGPTTQFKLHDDPLNAHKNLLLYTAIESQPIHSDAVVRIVVADE